MLQRLYRSNRDRMVAGIAGGMAEYFKVDPALVRIAWALLLLTGVGPILYIVCWIVIPERSAAGQSEPETVTVESPADGTNRFDGSRWSSRGTDILGVILIIAGAAILARHFIPWFRSDLLWPLLLVGLGIFLLVRRRQAP